MFYADLPSIFDNHSSSSSYKNMVEDVQTENSDQPVFNSFLFADSDPLNRAAFVTSSSIEIETTDEQQRMDDCPSKVDENNVSSAIQTTSSSPSPVIDDFDEDDFDGIPIRYTPMVISKKFNGSSDIIPQNDQCFDELIDRMDHDLEDDSFLNGFTDEQHDATVILPSLFQDIPDIDDPNQPEEEDDDRIPFDHMDMSDQSNSIRSASPDSLLSSDEHDDDDEVEQWNDDHLLATTAPKPSRENLPIHPFDQVDFIDLSRSNSRCSNVSSHLSVGYADQAREFLTEDELLTSSDSESDDENDDRNANMINFDREDNNDDDDDICLQVNLDHQPRSFSSSSKSNSTRSSSPMPDETPIADVDDDHAESKPLEIAPIAALDEDDDDDDDDGDNDFEPYLSYHPTIIRDFIQLKLTERQNDLVHDIITIRHFFNENNHNDEFLAIMHKPKMFEEVLSNDTQKESESTKQTNFIKSTFRPSTQLSIDNQIKEDSFEHHQHIQQTSTLSESNGETLDPRKTSTKNSSLPDGNHLNKETDPLINVSILPSTTIMINSDDESSDDDLELLQTLSQIHGLINHVDSSKPIDSPEMNEEKTIFNIENEEQQVPMPFIPSSPVVINTIKQSDEEQEKKNVIFHKNYNDVEGDEIYQARKKDGEEEKEGEEKNEPTTFFSSTSTTSPPIFFIDDSHSPFDIDASSSLPTGPFLLPFNDCNDSIQHSNQLITDDDLQISKMNHLLDHDELNQQTTFDPFAMFESKDTEEKRPVNNNNFDDLWNPSNQLTNLTWESLFGEETTDLKEYLNWILNHLNESEPIITFTSTQNLESIVKDIQMSTLPFEPIPSPPLHVDHTVNNPMINAIHHDLFPIDELEQPNQTQGQPSMIIYEEDEDQEKQTLSFDEQAKLVVEKLVSDTLQTALTELEEPYQSIEHFVDRILTQAIVDVYDEDQANEPVQTENLASIITWHDQTKATSKQLPDPFDQKFDSVWTTHFQSPDDPTHENPFEHETKPAPDPWLMASSSNRAVDPMVLFSQTFEDTDLFPTANRIEEDESTANTLSEYLPPLILTNPSTTTMATSNTMKYTLTAPVMDDSGDDSSTLEDYFSSRKNESSIETNQKVDEPSKGEENLSPFTAFTHNQPSQIESKYANIIAQFDEEPNESSQTDVNAAWTSIEKPVETTKSSGIGDDEPWELEDNGEEKMVPIPTTTRLKPNENSPTEKVNLQSNFFSDSFIPNEETEPPLTKTVRFDDHVQSIRAATPTKEMHESLSSYNDSEEIEVDDIATSFEKVNHRMEASYVTISEADLSNERQYESIESPPSIPTDTKDSPTPNTSNDHHPLQTSTETEYKINLRSEAQPPTTAAPNAQIVQPYESVLLRSTSKDETNVDPDEIDGVIPCVIDNRPVNIDAKAIHPFKCVINTAGALQEDNQTAVIAIYGCELPDHRLREYRYIMDQLFYYVYHKLEKMVIHDYVLIYFHGATSKHRTPDLKFLRKCYQMINFRLRKNLRSVYVVHPTRWLRTVIALSRPFFSKKFYHKINYIYTVAELERQFPRNRLLIPAAIEQTDWLYSQKYDRANESINRFITQPAIVRSINNNEDESVA